MTRFVRVLLCCFFAASICAGGDEVHFLFSHGWKDNPQQADYYVESCKEGARPHVITAPHTAPQYSDATYRFWRTNFGQEDEMATLEAGYQRCCQDNARGKIVFFGVSRGASNALALAAKPTVKRLAALVLESPYDSAESLVEKQIDARVLRPLDMPRRYLARLARFTLPSVVWRYVADNPITRCSSRVKKIFVRHAARTVLRYCTSYRLDGLKPLDAIKNLPKRLPILLICSKGDGSVPLECSLAVYRALRQAGHSRTYLVQLPRGKHARIKRDSDEGKLFQAAVHAFYRRHGIAHNQELADAGDGEFAEMQSDGC